MRREGKPLFSIGSGLLERELVLSSTSPDAIPDVSVRGRAGIPVSKGLANCPTRRSSAGAAVIRRFGSWEAFLMEPPFDQLFAIERKLAVSAGYDAVDDDGAESDTHARGLLVVRPRLISAVQRARLLTRASMALDRHLHAEFSVWWREGKVQLPEYTQRRMLWWDHKPKLPLDIQIMSRHKRRHRIFDERFLYKQQLVQARNDRRKSKRADWNEERKGLIAAKQAELDEKRGRAQAAAEYAKSERALGRSTGLVATSMWKKQPKQQGRHASERAF